MTEIFGGKMAFPIHNTGRGAPFDEGMTLRDYFAAKAMQGAIAHGLFNAEKGSSSYAEYVATIAYIYADAMLQARNGGE
jgi:hypothetical protein